MFFLQEWPVTILIIVLLYEVSVCLQTTGCWAFSFQKVDMGSFMCLTIFEDGGVYVAWIYLHARWSYPRQFRSVSLCPLSVEHYYFPSLVDRA